MFLRKRHTSLLINCKTNASKTNEQKMKRGEGAEAKRKKRSVRWGSDPARAVPGKRFN